jgi:succinylarginine dihydrolase
MNLIEVQIDRLVGPTHHFGGLGVGNLASQQHSGQLSNPAAAALQGLDKMRLVASFGVPQIILPPQPRPDFQFLRSLGFGGTDSDALRRAYDDAPHLLSAATSCSAMWTANAATVTPGADSQRDSTTVTIANLVASVHRAIEPQQTLSDLRGVIPAECFLNGPLAGGAAMRDEGAANHMRLGTNDARCGINIVVYGDGDPKPESNWPRQSRAACEAIARLHGLPSENTFLLKQHPTAIDAARSTMTWSR